MKKLAYVLLSIMLLLACSKGKDLSDFSSNGARGAAEYFYSLLAKGKSQDYVDNMQGTISMDSSKYVQYVDLVAQFLHEEKQLRGGILSAKAINETMEDTMATVFLNVHFVDSTREQVMLPLVYTRGRWWVK